MEQKLVVLYVEPHNDREVDLTSRIPQGYVIKQIATADFNAWSRVDPQGLRPTIPMMAVTLLLEKSPEVNS